MQQSAEVTNWPERIALVVAMVGIFILALLLMRRAWNAKKNAQSDIAGLPSVPADFEARSMVEGRFLGSTIAGAWLSRVVVFSLGVPARATISISSVGLLVERDGSSPFFIVRSELVDVRSDRAIAGRAFEKDGVAVITWRHRDNKGRDVFLDLGFRADSLEGHAAIVSMMMQESGA
jgi:hypothetical protein